MKILVVIPAFNESSNIIGLLRRIKSINNKWDILVINDASTDGTGSLAKMEQVKVCDLPINLGIGGAVQTGYLYALYNNYDIAVQVDGDGQHDPLDLPKLLNPIISGKADMVVGTRFMTNDGYKSTFLRRLGIRYFGNLIYLLTNKRFTDPTSGYRACNRQVISLFAREYSSDYPEPESLVLLHRMGYRIEEVSVVMQQRKAGLSSINSYKTIYYMIKVTLAIVINLFKKREMVAKSNGNKIADSLNS